LSIASPIPKAAQALLARANSASSLPRVLWQRLTESPEDFDRRMIAMRAQLPPAQMLLAVQSGRRQSAPLAGVKPVELPPKLFQLLHPAKPSRYRCATGGRGSAKSWSFATVLILLALACCIRILCVREVQLSIRQSVHRLLTDTINRLQLNAFFEVEQHCIRSRAGGSFIFEGLFSNVSKIRSIEGVNLVWCEESESISANSWETLIPTIRQPNSEIWVTMNPDLEDSSAYRRFISAPPPCLMHTHVILFDNPWLPEELRREAEYLASVDDDAYQHVWMGTVRKHSDAIIFKGKFTVEPFEPGAHWNGPFFGFDPGFAADPSVITKSWIFDGKLYIEAEAWQLHCDIDRLPQLFDQLPGARAQTIRCDSARPETVSYLRAHGYPGCVSVEKWPDSIIDGIAHLRSYQKIILHPSCVHTLQEMRLYSHKIDKLTGDILADIIDRHNHAIDSLRYALAPLIKGSGPGALLQWMAQDAATLKTQALALIDRPNVVIRDLTTGG